MTLPREEVSPGSVEAGARLAYYSLLGKKHVVEVNVEMDVLIPRRTQRVF